MSKERDLNVVSDGMGVTVGVGIGKCAMLNSSEGALVRLEGLYRYLNCG